MTEPKVSRKRKEHGDVKKEESSLTELEPHGHMRRFKLVRLRFDNNEYWERQWREANGRLSIERLKELRYARNLALTHKEIIAVCRRGNNVVLFERATMPDYFLTEMREWCIQHNNQKRSNWGFYDPGYFHVHKLDENNYSIFHYRDLRPACGLEPDDDNPLKKCCRK